MEKQYLLTKKQIEEIVAIGVWMARGYVEDDYDHILDENEYECDCMDNAMFNRGLESMMGEIPTKDGKLLGMKGIVGKYGDK